MVTRASVGGASSFGATGIIAHVRFIDVDGGEDSLCVACAISACSMVLDFSLENKKASTSKNFLLLAAGMG